LPRAEVSSRRGGEGGPLGVGELRQPQRQILGVVVEYDIPISVRMPSEVMTWLR
jgi:hypothetical protein